MIASTVHQIEISSFCIMVYYVTQYNAMYMYIYDHCNKYNAYMYAGQAL